MTRSWRSAAVLALLAAASSSFSLPKGAVTVVTVSDAVSLVKAIAPGRTVVLKDGDYLLSSAYGVETDYASWDESGEGKELSLSGIDGLTLRGSGKARILSDAPSASMLAIYDSSSVSFDGLGFARASEGEEEASAGSLYAEAVKDLTLRKCSFSGDTATAIELWGCSGVRIEGCEVTGANAGALAATNTGELVVSGSRVSGCEGYPLLYFEESGGALVADSRFEANQGDTFVEVRSKEGGARAVTFESCVFDGNDVDYFSGPEPLPVTEGCSFTGNSFDEGWREDSVAPSNEEEYASVEEDARLYKHPAGLSFSYPSGWELVEYGRESRVGVFAPDGDSLALFLVASKVPAGFDPAKASSAGKTKLFADSARNLSSKLREGSGISLFLEADGEPYSDAGLLSADYEGRAEKGEGELASARARFVVSGNLVCAMLALAEDPSALGTEGDLDRIFSSIGRTAVQAR